jgi:hypothetical protein
MKILATATALVITIWLWTVPTAAKAVDYDCMDSCDADYQSCSDEANAEREDCISECDAEENSQDAFHCREYCNHRAGQEIHECAADQHYCKEVCLRY